MDIKDLLELMRGMKDNHIDYVKLDRDDETITLKRHKKVKTIAATSAPALTAPMQDITDEVAAEAQDLQEISVQEALVGEIVTAPVVGVFFAAPSPESNPFVELGGEVKAGDIVCIIEAMKLMNEVASTASGRVLEIYAKNGEKVQYGDPLFRIG